MGGLETTRSGKGGIDIEGASGKKSKRRYLMGRRVGSRQNANAPEAVTACGASHANSYPIATVITSNPRSVRTGTNSQKAFATTCLQTWKGH